MLNIGYENYIAIEYVKAICGNAGASPIKKHLQSMKTNSSEKIIDFTNGNALKSIVYLTDGTIVLSSLASKTLKDRYQALYVEQYVPSLKNV